MLIQYKYVVVIVVFFLGTCHLIAQEKIYIEGKITGNLLELSNVHIYNENSKQGTITDIEGHFTIKVKLNDVLTISGIQFATQRKKIDENCIASKQLEIPITFIINELNLVNVKSHNLSGNLLSDSNKVPDEYLKYQSYQIKLNESELSTPLNITSALDVKSPNPLRSTEDVQSVNLSVLVMKLIRKISTKRKKERKQFVFDFPTKLRNDLGDDFFINDLKIPKPVIDYFINYCKPKGIISLYKQNKMIELIEVLISESEVFIEYLKSDNKKK